MSSVVISGDTSGSVTLSAPAVAGSPTLTLPTTTGTVALTSDVVGVNQTWQLPTRVSGTSYTNSTGKPIQVIVYITQTLAGSGTSVVVVGGVTIVNGNYQSNATGGSQPISYSFIVPNSTSYTVTVTGGCSLGVWAELR